MVKITKYEQSAFVLDMNDKKYIFDYGSHSTAKQIKDIGKVDASFVTHIHEDHLCVEHLAKFNAKVYGPNDVIKEISKVTYETVEVSEGQILDGEGFNIEVINCDHGPNVKEKIDNVAFIITIDEIRVYYTGDIGAGTYKPEGKFNLVLIPIGGDSVFDPTEAKKYLLSMKHVGMVIPLHYYGDKDKEAVKEFKKISGDKYKIKILDIGDSYYVS